MASSLKWNGDAIKAKALAAAKHGVNKTMSEAVQQFKRNHPGWRNVTGLAEGSVDVTQFAKRDARGVMGQWGSRGVAYMLPLEFLRGSALRNAAGATYPRLKDNIQAAFKASPGVR
jgi:hypothetical protein